MTIRDVGEAINNTRKTTALLQRVKRLARGGVVAVGMGPTLCSHRLVSLVVRTGQTLTSHAARPLLQGPGAAGPVAAAAVSAAAACKHAGCDGPVPDGTWVGFD